MKRYTSIYLEAEALPHKSLLRIKDPALYVIADRLIHLGLMNPTTNFKAIKKANDNKLLQLFTKKTGQEFQKAIGVRDFTLQDIINFDKQLNLNKNGETKDNLTDPNHPFSYKEYSIFNDTVVLKHITKDLSTWTGAQRFITNLDNHVLQFNIDWEWFKNYSYEENSNLVPFIIMRRNFRDIEDYIKNSNHPTSRTKLTLGWCRFTLLKPGIIDGDKWHDKKNSDAWAHDLQQTYGDKWQDMHRSFVEVPEKSVILDEIQTDLNDKRFLGEELMQGWQEYMMRKFIYFIRGSLKVRKIYMPTYESKQNLYHANPPMSLYKELPNKFGFKKDSDLKGFMLLENVK